MAKPRPDDAPDDIVTLTKAEYEAALAEAAANAAVRVQRGQTFIEGMTEAAEERVEKILGKPRDPRKPWPTLTATFSYEAPDWAGPVTGTVEFKVRDIDEDGQPLDKPQITTLRLTAWQLPSLIEMQAKHGFDDRMTFAPEGYGKRRPDIKDNAYFTREFIQYVVKNVYETPLTAMFSGKDVKFIKPYLTSDLRPVDLGEIRREVGIAARRAA